MANPEWTEPEDWEDKPLASPTPDLAARLTRLAEWYEAGPKYPVEFEEGRQRIAADLRAAIPFIPDGHE